MQPNEAIAQVVMDSINVSDLGEYALEEIHRASERIAAKIEAALVQCATDSKECDCNEGYGFHPECVLCQGTGILGHPPKFAVYRIRDGHLEAVDCPNFVFLAKDRHATDRLMAYQSTLEACGNHSPGQIAAMDHHIHEFLEFEPKKEPD